MMRLGADMRLVRADVLEELLTKVVLLFEQGYRLEAVTGVAAGWNDYCRRRGLDIRTAAVE